MTCTEEYREHIEYTFHAFCKVVIRNATINAARTRSRKHKREISLEYLTDEKHYPLGTTDEYFQAPGAGRGIHTYPLRRYGHFQQRFTCGSPVTAGRTGAGNDLPVLFQAYSTARNWQTVRAQPQHSGLPYPKSPTAAPSGNGGNGI